ncbi:hypothetical protein G7Y89_g12834 [Cudoniella acicularis]|uniref:Myb-like DNA-binding domain-containing protein n=1 Tax=Cudoniella acicularis TaxID=354080 RepID=A0A8H4R8G7_9HELO|nr:hypothetical protein G7Y89_g12834 [Cudoniella acicularis]
MAEDAAAASTTESKTGMPQADVEFLIACLKNTTGGSIAIDTKAVAEAMNYTNHRSVGNRISALKKKYDLPFGASGVGKKAKEGESSEPTVPSTPNANRVTKKRTPAKKKTPSKKAVKKEESEPEEEEDATMVDDDMAVKAASAGINLHADLGEYDAYFGPTESGEEQEEEET